jgi:UDP-2-acetamido-2-deoxy-ribo-hexuluronate aminotransferase
MSINLLDLSEQSKIIKKNLLLAIEDIIDSTDFIQGKQVQELEKILESYTGATHCITCGNGTDALQIALGAAELEPNQYIICPSFTFIATAEVIPRMGLIPYFVDVEKDSFNISITQIKEAIQKILNDGGSVGAIISVDLYGLPADYSSISALAKENNIIFISDCAQSFGAKFQSMSVCSLPDIATTSFFPTKPLGCYGDGGAIFTSNEKYANIARSLAVHGKGDNKYDNVRIGFNSRLDTIQAAVLLEKFKLFDAELEMRQKVADTYSQLINHKVILPKFYSGLLSAWAQYTLTLESAQERAQLQKFLSLSQIPTGIYYPKPMHAQLAYSDFPMSPSPISDYLADRVLSLPMSPYLSDQQIQKITDSINEFF